MRIVTFCTLAFAICGEREGKTSKTVQPKTSTNRRLLAKGLLLGASVHAVSGFGQPPHPARALGRPAGVRPLEPLKEGGIDTFKKIKKMFDPTARADRMSNWLEDALAGAERLEVGPHDPWAEWRPKAEMLLLEKDEAKLEEFWLDVMERNAKLDAEEGQELLTKIQNDQIDEMITKDDEAKWKALEDDIRDFQYWQQEARDRYLTYPTFKTESGKRVLTSLKGVMNHPVTLDTAKQLDQLLNAEEEHELLTQSAKIT